jgi:hypothetical protein
MILLMPPLCAGTAAAAAAAAGPIEPYNCPDQVEGNPVAITHTLLMLPLYALPLLLLLLLQAW